MDYAQMLMTSLLKNTAPTFRQCSSILIEHTDYSLVQVEAYDIKGT
jgi:hypothetical protein